MKIITYELKKIWRKRNISWMLLIVLLFICGSFAQNHSQKSTIKDRTLDSIKPYIEETDEIYKNLYERENDQSLDKVQAKQLEQVNKMATSLFNWKSSIYNEEWGKIPAIEHDFIKNLQRYSDYGGEFQSLQGVERDKALNKNNWLLKYKLSYEDEDFPLAPALFLKESTLLAFGVAGIVLILLLFGNIVSVEKEQHTWLTLITQPISKSKLIFGKYACLLVLMIIFLGSVLILGFIISWIFGSHATNFQYPQLVMSGGKFTFITTMDYLIRASMLCMSMCLVSFGIVILLSNWIKGTFSLLITTSFILIVGYFLPEISPIFNKFWSPFYSFHYNSLLTELPKSANWLSLVIAFIWSMFLVSLAIILPEKAGGFFHSSEYKKPFHQGETKGHSSPLLAASLFEYRKVRRKGLFKQVNVFLFLLIVLGYYLLSEQANEKEKTYFQELYQTAHDDEEVLSFYQHQISALEAEKSTPKDQLDDIKKAEATIQKLLNKLKKGLAAYKEGDWLPLYKYQLLWARFANNEIDTGRIITGIKENAGQFSVDASIAEKKWLIAHHIPPTFPGEFTITLFSNWDKKDEDAKNKWIEMNQKVDDSGLFSLYLFFEKYLYLTLPILFLFLFGAGFASERGKTQTLHLLKTLPLAEKHLFLGKIVNASIYSLISCMGIFIFVVFIGTLFNRFGDWQYPILYYDHPKIAAASGYTGEVSFRGNGFHFIPLGDHLLHNILIAALLLIFIIVLSNFISLFFKNTFTVFAITIFILLLGFLGSTTILTDFAYLSPFTYFNIAQITNGELSILMDQPRINFQIGSIALLISTVILILIGYVVLDRKNK